MDEKKLFKGPMDQNIRIGSDLTFWSKVYQQLAEAEDVYAKRQQKVIDMLNGRIGQRNAVSSKDFENMKLHVETFKDHVITQKRKVVDTMQTYRNSALQLRRSSVDKWIQTANKVDSITMDSLTKEFKKKQKLVAQSKLDYHREMEKVEKTKIQMLRLGYTRDTLDRTLEEIERNARESRVRYNHSIRQAENQLTLLSSVARQCERDWKEMEQERTGQVIRLLDSYFTMNCTTCMKSEESLSAFINIPNLVNSLADKDTLPTVEFEEYEMTLLRLVMSKLNSQTSQRSDTETGHFEYDTSKVKCCHVIKSFRDKRPHFLSLKKGTSVKELIPATAQGWAFGEARTGKGKALKYGFYNVSCVVFAVV